MILVGHFQLGMFWFHLYLFHIFNRFTVYYCPWLICKSMLFFFFSTWEPQKKKTRKEQEELFNLLLLEQFQKLQQGNCKKATGGKISHFFHSSYHIHSYTHKSHCIQINERWWKYKKQMTTIVKFNLPYVKEGNVLQADFWFHYEVCLWV